MDVLINVVHQIGPLADGTPQEPLDVERRPADSKHGDNDRYSSKKNEIETVLKTVVVFLLLQFKHFSSCYSF